jgi:hypothetical protein
MSSELVDRHQCFGGTTFINKVFGMRCIVVWWTDTNIWEQPVASMSYSENEGSRFIGYVVTCLPNYRVSHSRASHHKDVGKWSIVSGILYLSFRWRRVISYTTRGAFPAGKEPSISIR